MDLTYEESERYLDQICSGTLITTINNVPLLFKQPKLTDKMKARYIYDCELKSAVEGGFLNNVEMKALLKERALLTDEERLRLSKLESQLAAQKVLLARTTKVKARQDDIKKVIADKEREIRELESKEQSKYAMTAETKAEEARILFMCWASCFDFIKDSLYWPEHKDFLNEHDYVFRQRVVSVFISFYSGLSTSILRAIARSDLWRIKYITSMKTSESLFGIPTSEYDNNQSKLAYWSHYYQSIYEMMPDDKPDELIIMDDEALDAYMADYYKEKSRDAVGRRNKQRHGSLSAFDKEEVIVTRSDPLYEHIEYDKPREAQAIKNKAMISKRTRRG